MGKPEDSSRGGDVLISFFLHAGSCDICSIIHYSTFLWMRQVKTNSQHHFLPAAIPHVQKGAALKVKA